MEDTEMYDRMKTVFYDKMNEIMQQKNVNTQIFTQAAYISMIAKVEHAKSLKFGKTPGDYARLKKFDILEINGVKRLVVPFFCSTSSSGSKSSTSIRMFVYLEEIFDILHAAHLKIGHKRRGGMMEELTQFKNITRQMIQVYLDICEVCNEKKKTQENTPNISYIDFMGMPTDENGYNAIFLHMDVKTQFVQLRPLKTTDTQEVSRCLIDIFSIFGPPDIIQGNISNAFGEQLQNDLVSSWFNWKVIYIKTEDKVELLNEIKNKITELLNSWIERNRTLEWSEGLSFVQYMKNKRILSRFVGQALFGNTFGKIVDSKKSKAIEHIDQTTADNAEECNIVEKETSAERDNTQYEIEKAAKRVKLEHEANDSNTIVIQKFEASEEIVGSGESL